jgi:hypothetical protein
MGAPGELDQGVVGQLLPGRLLVAFPGGLEQVVDDAVERSVQLGLVVDGAAAGHAPGAVGVAVLPQLPLAAQPLVRPLGVGIGGGLGAAALVAQLGQAGTLGRHRQQLGLRVRAHRCGVGDVVGLSERQASGSHGCRRGGQVGESLGRHDLGLGVGDRRPRHRGDVMGRSPETLAAPDLGLLDPGRQQRLRRRGQAFDPVEGCEHPRGPTQRHIAGVEAGGERSHKLGGSAHVGGVDRIAHGAIIPTGCVN